LTHRKSIEPSTPRETVVDQLNIVIVPVNKMMNLERLKVKVIEEVREMQDFRKRPQPSQRRTPFAQ
jgi:hypothetical protein